MMKKKFGSLVLVGSLMASLLFSACTSGGSTSTTSSTGSTGTAATATTASAGVIKVGVVNNPPSESGYREANVKDMEAVFSTANGYELKTAYSLKNDEQLQAAQGFITEGVDYLLISAAETTAAS